MKIKQLALFLENRPGHVGAICRTLADAGINIVTLALADTQQFGILRLIVRDWEHARETLQAKGFVVNVTDVVAAEVDDRPGGLSEVLEILEEGGVNVEYLYALTSRRNNRAVLIFRFGDPDAAIRQLQSAGVNIVGAADVLGKPEKAGRRA
jgi:hypothetical protein